MSRDENKGAQPLGEDQLCSIHAEQQKQSALFFIATPRSGRFVCKRQVSLIAANWSLEAQVLPSNTFPSRLIDSKHHSHPDNHLSSSCTQFLSAFTTTSTAIFLPSFSVHRILIHTCQHLARVARQGYHLYFARRLTRCGLLELDKR